MAKKSIKIEVEESAEALVSNGLCEYCQARPATLTANNGKRYCCLACMSNDHS